MDAELRIEHVHKQGVAEGFQQGWHAALQLVSEDAGECPGHGRILHLQKIVPVPADFRHQPAQEDPRATLIERAQAMVHWALTVEELKLLVGDLIQALQVPSEVLRHLQRDAPPPEPREIREGDVP